MSFAIFLPVRNGGVYIKACVNSILNQTCEDFSLFVLENASTDDTLDWLKSIDDKRMTIYESDGPLSIEENWARIIEIETNHEYMTIIGHDDMLDPNYLETMLNLIKIYPDAGLYQAHFRLVDESGKKIRVCMRMPDIEHADEFLRARLMFRRDSFGTGYMFRRSDYVKLGGIPQYKKLMFADDALWLLLMKDSYKATTNTECFSYREHSASTSGSPDWQSTYAALNCYLDFLKQMAEENKAVSSELVNHLNDYMMYWYQWAYLGASHDIDKNEMENAIWVMVSKVKRLLQKLNASGLNNIEQKVKTHVFGQLAQVYWAYTRIVTWVYRRL